VIEARRELGFFGEHCAEAPRRAELGQDALDDQKLVVPSAPRFLARNTSAMPPAPSRRMISKSARRSGTGRGGSSVMGRKTALRLYAPAAAGDLRQAHGGPRVLAFRPQLGRTPLKTSSHRFVCLALPLCLLALGCNTSGGPAKHRLRPRARSTPRRSATLSSLPRPTSCCSRATALRPDGLLVGVVRRQLVRAGTRFAGNGATQGWRR